MPGTPPGILLPSKSIFPGVTSADGLVIEIAGVLLRGASRCRIRLYFSVFRCFCPLSPLPPSLRGRVLGRNVQLSAFPRAFAPSSPDTLPFLAVFCIPVRFCPLIPPAPFSHKGRRGCWGVLMPFFPHPPAPCCCTGRRGECGAGGGRLSIKSAMHLVPSG